MPECLIKVISQIFKIVAFLIPTVQLLESKTLVSLIRISPNFDAIDRNDCWLTCSNQNCDIPVHFQMPGGKWTTIVKSRHNLQFLCGYWTTLDQICTVCREDIAIESFWIEIAIIESLSKCQRVEKSSFRKFCSKKEKEVRIKKIHANTYHM